MSIHTHIEYVCMSENDKVKPTCPRCGKGTVYFRTDGSKRCTGCGYDSRYPMLSAALMSESEKAALSESEKLIQNLVQKGHLKPERDILKYYSEVKE